MERKPAKKAYTLPKPEEQRWLPKSVAVWFEEKRKITLETVKAWQIYYAKHFMPDLGREEHTVAFPHYRDGVLVNVQYRTAEKGFAMVAGAERVFFGLDMLTKDYSKPLVITEGQIDALSCWQAGYTEVLSVPNGAPGGDAKNLDNHLGFLDTAIERLAPYAKIILAGDDDANGRRLTEELARRLGYERCWKVTWPEGCKDANDVLVTHGDETLVQALDGAEEWPIDGLLTIRDIMPEVVDLYEHGRPHTVSTGWMTLDDYYTIQEGEFTLVTGAPGHGKSRWLANMMLNVARRDRWRFLLFSPEFKPRRIVQTLVEQCAKKPLHGERRMSLEDLWEAEEFLQEHVTIVSPGTHHAATVTDLLEYAKLAIRRYGVKGIVLDPWSYITKAPGQRQSVTDYVAEKITEIKTFTGTYGCHLWLVAHPTKLTVAKSGPYAERWPPPTAYDVADSAHWNNGPDNILSIWRDYLEPENTYTEVHIQKIRDEYTGQPGMVRLRYDKSSKTYHDDEPATGPQPWEAPPEEPTQWTRTYPHMAAPLVTDTPTLFSPAS